MKLLLDTHTWIWAIETPQKLGRAVRRQLERPANQLYLSPISIWETHMLVQRKRVRLKRAFTDWLDDALRNTPLREAPFNFAVAEEASRIQLPQRDPGDLFLAATAVVFDFTLVTADSQLLDYKGLKTLANR
ncbi:MAG TPA: type II toxin-antitoxin system VapC family toxin [Bryobacteraceae bacterium]|nr:type II toxin-antitoxin system VapC family toxin [Bryobacteraceae bacterium]